MKKTVCIVLPTHYSAFMGGAQYQAKCIAEALALCGQYDVHFLARNIAGDFQSELYNTQKIQGSKLGHKLGFFTDALSLYRILENIKPDVIYQRIACAYTGICAYYAQRNACKSIWHVAHVNDVTPGQHTISKPYLLEKLDKAFVEYGIRHSSHIITQTNEQNELLQNNYQRTADRIIYNLHPMPGENISKSTSPIRIIWVANLKPWKQPDIFLRLAKDMSQYTNVEFIMAGALQGGDKSWQQEILKKVDQLGNLTYLNQITQDEVNTLLAESHIFVNTSRNEGFANTFIQAWMRKVPVLSLCVNPDNLFDRHEIGFYAGNYENLLDKTRLLAEDHVLRNTYGENARNYAYQNHSLDNIKHLIELIEEPAT